MECQLPLEEGRVPAGPEPDADAATDTSRPLARWQIKVSRFRFLLRPNVSAHPLLIRHMTLDRQHIWRCTDSRQPDVTVCSVTKSGPPAGVQRRPQLQQRQDPDAVRWSLSDLQPGHRGHVQAEGETSYCSNVWFRHHSRHRMLRSQCNIYVHKVSACRCLLSSPTSSYLYVHVSCLRLTEHFFLSKREQNCIPSSSCL